MNVEAATTNSSFNYLIKIPPTYIRVLQESFIFAIEELHVDEKTNIRDALELQVEDELPQKEILLGYYRYVKYVEFRASCHLRSILAKRDKLLRIIDKAKNSISIEHIDSKICDLEALILEALMNGEFEDKQYFTREFNQLKQRREKLSSSLFDREEEKLSSLFDREEEERIRQIREAIEDAEDRLKFLEKEIQILRDSALEAEARFVKFRKKKDDAMQQIEELQRQYKVAVHACEEAIANKESIEKSYHDKMLLLSDCSSNGVLAHLYVASEDCVVLSRYCKNNVEKFMKRWNEDDEFRREYAKFNESSTITRFGSLDGARSHVSDKESPIQ
ncbi:hypothetical protein ABFS82_01G024900 [Erythranthe guttata]|uniref:Uncharacterized protein n=1 Tax=Erythranthe guttata TaxID=4155 RepID=A0A022Q3V9_ERYGU|nr:PREDICTED: uncharacterized protein LOC105975376 [Erythranthe guttata]XP_012856026.1 PREDICTED: uncharacterized protein LOC105975376 [Erythranthe guttata]EYU21892.1 hypothetical protein MIMGU_mgv1a009750mg [Erythranthe guttata]EYU21893.1 hypothetical protein MIMGU_mgv1a009750mg [Erythranthe guttata]|eukprot:XP_012856025.1 PREDICTED: uncharacterized protein LOC105975376 [Erythranthe guttata]